MISALLGSEQHVYGLACHTSGGSCEHPLAESETESRLQFESLCRPPRSASQMLRKKNFLGCPRTFHFSKNISGTTSCFRALISALHQNTKQFYMQVVHTSFSIQLPDYFPSYSVKKKFSKIQIFVRLALEQP